MDLEITVVDAFTDSVFKGNPAAVIITDSWLSDDLMQSIAAENNLSETVFLILAEVPTYQIRCMDFNYNYPLESMENVLASGSNRSLRSLGRAKARPLTNR